MDDSDDYPSDLAPRPPEMVVEPDIPVDAEPVSSSLGAPRLEVADFLQQIVDDLKARRAIVVGRDYVGLRVRIKALTYDVTIVRTGTSENARK